MTAKRRAAPSVGGKRRKTVPQKIKTLRPSELKQKFSISHPEVKLPAGFRKDCIGNLLSYALGRIDLEKENPQLAKFSVHAGAFISDRPDAPNEAVFPVILKLKTQSPQPNEGWDHYKERIEDHLEPVRKKVEETMGIKPSKLIAANALKVSASADQIKVLAVEGHIEKIELDPLLKVTLMDDVYNDVRKDTFIQRNPGVDGSGVRVAVLDSGIDTRHPYLQVSQSVSTSGEDIALPGLHATHCAGSIASRDTLYKGIAPGVTLLNVKVLNANGSGVFTGVVKGIDEAMDLGAEVISMSLGFNHMPTWSGQGHGWMCDNGHCPLCVAVDNAVALENVIIIVAAGNEHNNAEYLRSNGYRNQFDTELCCPGQARRAITVGAVSKHVFDPAPFSSRGPTTYKSKKPDIVAPGVNITSTVPVQRDAHGNPIDNPARASLFTRLSGTSMATPIVAGAAALIVQELKSAGKAVTPNVVRKALYNKGIVRLAGLNRNIVGRGRLDLSRL